MNVTTLAAIDTTGVAPLWQPHTDAMPLRADQTTPSLSQAEALAQAPAAAGGHFAVPKVV